MARPVRSETFPRSLKALLEPLRRVFALRRRKRRGVTGTPTPDAAADEAARAHWEDEGGRVTTTPHDAGR